MKNKNLLVELVEKWGLLNVSREVDHIVNLVFVSEDSSWATYNDSENNDAYDRVCILYEALECMKVNTDLSIEFIAMPKFENIEYILIKEIFESKDSKFFDNDNKKMERYKELLINNQ